MRKLTKAQKPAILDENEAQWLQAVTDNPTDTNKTRYRDPAIKQRLVEETHDKCAYCESKMRPVTPSHIEHKVPVRVSPELRFSWTNLTICCPECNRRKGGYYNEHTGFIDPYVDEVENRLVHRGPIVGWAPGDQCAELSVKFLGLDGYDRVDLIMKKIEKINEVDDLVERYQAVKGSPLESFIKKRLMDKTKVSAEYSAMVRSIFKQSALDDLIT